MTTTHRTLPYQVRSCNFDWHPALQFATYQEALTAAKARGFESRIEHVGPEGITLVATWSALYGVHWYNRELAGVA